MMKPLAVVKLYKVKVGARLLYKAAWWARRDGIRRRFTETIGVVGKVSHRDAKDRCTSIQASLNGEDGTMDKMGRATLASFLEDDLDIAAQDLKRSSLRELRTAGEHACAALGADTNVHLIGVAEVSALKKYLQARSLAASTVLKNLSYMQGAFRRGVDHGVLQANPFAGMRRPKFQTARAKVFNQDEIEAMLAVSNEWWAAFIQLGATSGLRRGEMTHLQWDSINLEESTVTVNPQKGGEFTVDGKTYPLLAWESKDYETRVLPLPADTLGYLRLLKAKAGTSPYVFVSLKRLAHIARQSDPDFPVLPNLGRPFRAIQKKAKAQLEWRADGSVPWNVRPIKALRSTYATTMSRHVSSFELRDLMGHSSVTTTEKHYVATTSDIAKKIQAAFGREANRAATA